MSLVLFGSNTINLTVRGFMEPRQTASAASPVSAEAVAPPQEATSLARQDLPVAKLS